MTSRPVTRRVARAVDFLRGLVDDGLPLTLFLLLLLLFVSLSLPLSLLFPSLLLLLLSLFHLPSLL